jgi:hypothetical protein
MEIVQSTVDPRHAVYAGTWDNLAAFERALTGPDSPARDARLEAQSAPRYFEPLYRFEVAAVTGSATAFVFFEGTEETAASLQGLLLQHARIRDHRKSGVVRCAIGREIGRSWSFLLALHYRTAEDFARARSAAGVPMKNAMEALGCTVQPFYGHTILAFDCESESA